MQTINHFVEAGPGIFPEWRCSEELVWTINHFVEAGLGEFLGMEI